MASIITNTSAQIALRSLSMTNAALEKTQQRISTGLRVGTAEDNAAYWSIATTMRSDRSALNTVKDALGLGAATVDVAYTGMNSAIDVVKEIKNKLVAARQPGVDRAKVQTEISELQNQLVNIGDSSVFSNENWLSVDSSAASFNATKTIVASFARSGGAVSVGTISIDITNVKLFDASGAATGILDELNGTYSVSTLSIAALTDSAADLTTLEGMITWTDDAISSMTTSAATLGSAKQRVNLQKDFVGSLMDAIDRGISTLVDADMTEESTKLQALQVQQQLGTQALSIANQSSQSILSLFR
ncbi:MAG: flagellin [Rhizobiales bacterium]|nr:flagellin [Hyphomicrobiales bacterium]